jgi:hypothetical protein
LSNENLSFYSVFVSHLSITAVAREQANGKVKETILFWQPNRSNSSTNFGKIASDIVVKKQIHYSSLSTDFATTIETAASPVTLTVVLHISKGLSIAKIRAKPASGIPA